MTKTKRKKRIEKAGRKVSSAVKRFRALFPGATVDLDVNSLKPYGMDTVAIDTRSEPWKIFRAGGWRPLTPEERIEAEKNLAELDRKKE